MPQRPRPLRALFYMLLSGGLLLAGVGCRGPITFVVGVTPGDQRLEATVVESDPGFGSDRVAIIDISGLILNAHKRGLLQQGSNPVSDLAEKLRVAGEDARVRAIILRLNTPGGGVTASDAMYREIKRFKTKTGKPVIALMMDVAASGGYYVACAADTIVAYPTTVTGSIGVIMQTVSFKPALQSIGIHTEALTSGPNKAAGSPLSVMTPEQRATLQKLVDAFYARFVEVVKEARPNIPPDRFAEVTDGRVMGGEEALTLGLVDQLGDLRDAFEVAKQQAGLDRADLVVYHRPLTYVGSPYSRAAIQNPATQINLLQMNIDLPSSMGMATGFYYLWQVD